MSTGKLHKLRLALGALAFCVLLLVVHVGLKYVYLNTVEAVTRPVVRDNLFYAHPDGVEILVLGNSHPFVAVDADQIGHTANLSDLDEGYMVNYYRLKDILARTGNSYKAVVLPLSLHGFRPVQPSDYEPPYRAKFIDFAQLALQSGEFKTIAYAWFRGQVVPYAGRSDDILGLFNSKKKSEIDEFLARMSTNWDASPAKLARTEAYVLDHFKGQHPFDPVSSYYFSAILGLCAKNNITVVLVEYPVTKLYFECATKTMLDYPKWQSHVESLVIDRPNIIRLDYKFTFGDDAFCDPLHLNVSGRNQFTVLLKGELDKHGLLASGTGSR